MSELRQVDVKELRALEDERDVLAAERAALLEQVVYWRECVQDMVAKAAANNLDGYRELGQRAANAENERDSWRRVAERLEGEKQALAAHVEAGKAVIANLLEVHMEDVSEWEYQKIREAAEWVAEAPTDSIARLKAKWQAEAVTGYAHRHLGGTEQELAEIYASKLRRQSQEPTE